jgi:LysM repeat protein
MPKPYTVSKGDTLARIAKQNYDDATLASRLADYNGIRDPSLIVVGQVLEIPSRKELLGQGSTETETLEFQPPNGFQAVLDAFGDIRNYLTNDGSLTPGWEQAALTRIDLPWPLTLSWDHSQSVTRIVCHKKLAGTFTNVFKTLDSSGLRSRLRSYGGCFAFRPKRSGSKLSTHSWGIAIDIDPETNAMGTPGDINPDVVAVFQKWGFKWGGDWPGKQKDPMHFQYCTGY